MSSIGDVTGSIGAGAGLLSRFMPEPRSRGGLSFGGVLKSVGSAIGSAAGGLDGINPVFVDLINKQIQTQFEMQIVSFESNIEKSKHETQMAAIRNIRVG